MKYYATLPAGLEKFAEKFLTSKKFAQKIQTYSGAILFESTTQVNDIVNLPFFTNVFVCLKTFGNATFFNMANTCETKMFAGLSHLVKGKKTFKLKFFEGGQFVKVNDNIKWKTEKTIKQALGLKLEIVKSDVEFWFIVRSDKTGFITMLLPQKPSGKEDKGELKSNLGFTLASLAEIAADDVVLDPFCGHGGIVKAIAKDFKFAELLACDRETNLVNALKNNFKNHKIKVFKSEYEKLELADDSITKIVTDPPWGDFEKGLDTKKLYDLFLTKSFNQLKKGGIMVLLVGRGFNTPLFVSGKYGFEKKESFDLLVNGKKATIIKLKKTIC